MLRVALPYPYVDAFLPTKKENSTDPRCFLDNSHHDAPRRNFAHKV